MFETRGRFNSRRRFPMASPMPQPLVSLLYVSIAAPRLAKANLTEIVEVARSRNAALDVSGALVFTGDHFAQVLEGPEEAIDQLMGSILRDPRHSAVNVVERPQIEERRFARWSLAYSGPSLFVERHITPLLGTDGADKAPLQSRRLIGLMHEFAERG